MIQAPDCLTQPQAPETWPPSYTGRAKRRAPGWGEQRGRRCKKCQALSGDSGGVGVKGGKGQRGGNSGKCKVEVSCAEENKMLFEKESISRV